MPDFAINSESDRFDLELVWRCLRCGHMWPDRGEPLPDACRYCGAPKTEFELVRED